MATVYGKNEEMPFGENSEISNSALNMGNSHI